jgi:phosphopantetheine adenylyltransferase
MRKLSQSELLTMRELLQSETNGLIKKKMTVPMVNDEDLKRYAEAAVMSCEVRIKAMQQFINENGIIDISEVH